jgi:hypothetical protein
VRFAILHAYATNGASPSLLDKDAWKPKLFAWVIMLQMTFFG